jgi:hypothetical protein
MRALIAIVIASSVTMLAGCGSDDHSARPTPTPVPATSATPTAKPSPSATAAASATATDPGSATRTASPTPPATTTPTSAASSTATAMASSTPTGAGSPTPSGTPTLIPNASSVVFAPAVGYLDNPTSSGSGTSPSDITLELTVYDAAGNPVTPSPASPITVNLYGAPAGVIAPTSLTLTTGTAATFSYTGAYFPNPISVTASMPVAGGGQAIGVTQILQANPIDCVYGSTSISLPLVCDGAPTPGECASYNVTNGLRAKATVGYAAPTAENFQTYTIDTGSLGVVVPLADLGPDAVGPAGPGRKYYDSSGNTYAGNYYLAPVSLRLADGSIAQTHPIMVLAITTAYCTGDNPKCLANPPKPTLHYLGVGFDRNNNTAEDQFDSPADNAFLQLTDATDGTDVSPGYVLTGSTLTLGIASTSGFALAPLAANSSVPGDWNAAPGCFSFPDLPEPNQFCGSLLLDVGIAEMFLELAPAQRPAAAVDSANQVPLGTAMEILVGTPADAAMSYQFTLSENPPADSPQPSYIDWNDQGAVFVNTGRHPLYSFDYLYDARCGHVGFQPTN